MHFKAALTVLNATSIILQVYISLSLTIINNFFIIKKYIAIFFSNDIPSHVLRFLTWGRIGLVGLS